MAPGLDPSLAPPHVALGLLHQHAFAWDSAATEFSTAVQLRTQGDVEPLIQYGRHLVFRGRVREGMQQFVLARRTEPASALVSSWMSYAFYLAGQPDSALAESERAYQSDTNNITTLAHGALIRLAAGRRDEARRLSLLLNPLNLDGLYTLSMLGATAITMARIRKAEAIVPDAWLVHTQRAYVSLGMRDTAAALTALERATDAMEMWPSWQSVVDPLFAPLWPTNRFRVLLERVGLRDVKLPSATR